MFAMLTIPRTKQFDFFTLKIRPTTSDRKKSMPKQGTPSFSVFSYRQLWSRWNTSYCNKSCARRQVLHWNRRPPSKHARYSAIADPVEPVAVVAVAAAVGVPNTWPHPWPDGTAPSRGLWPRSSIEHPWLDRRRCTESSTCPTASAGACSNEDHWRNCDCCQGDSERWGWYAPRWSDASIWNTSPTVTSVAVLPRRWWPSLPPCDPESDAVGQRWFPLFGTLGDDSFGTGGIHLEINRSSRRIASSPSARDVANKGAIMRRRESQKRDFGLLELLQANGSYLQNCLA